MDTPHGAQCPGERSKGSCVKSSLSRGRSRRPPLDWAVRVVCTRPAAWTRRQAARVCEQPFPSPTGGWGRRKWTVIWALPRESSDVPVTGEGEQPLPPASSLAGCRDSVARPQWPRLLLPPSSPSVVSPPTYVYLTCPSVCRLPVHPPTVCHLSMDLSIVYHPCIICHSPIID